MKTKISVLGPGFITRLSIYFREDEPITDVLISDLATHSLKSFVKTLPDTVPVSTLTDTYHFKQTEHDTNFKSPKIERRVRLYFRLNDLEVEEFLRSKKGIEFTFIGTSANILAKQQQIADFIYLLTKDKKIIIADLIADAFYSPGTWKVGRVAAFPDNTINCSSLVTIRTTREDGFCRAVTRGMSSFGLPEISVKNFPCSNRDNFEGLVSAVAQTLIENPFIDQNSRLLIELKKIKNKNMRHQYLQGNADNALLTTSVKLKAVQPQEGDNHWHQLFIAFENPDYASPQEEAHQLVADLFGFEETHMKTEHDEELLKASENAKKRLPELRTLFNKGLEPGYSITVKAPFKTPDEDNEWMWVEVTQWTDERIEGVLLNDPFGIPDLKVGAIVVISQLEVFDYMLNKPNGTTEGNETEKILKSRQ
ncbi:MAG TPA: DUF2314 domain-containing protein [Chryseolinea sp.]